MNTRETSIAAYYKIRDDGLLSKRRFKAYVALYHYGPMNRNQVAESTGMLPSAASARLGELRDLGVVREVGARKCLASGHKALVFDVTRELPVKKQKMKYKKCPHCDGKGKTPCIV